MPVYRVRLRLKFSTVSGHNDKMLIDRIWWGQWVKYLAQGQYNQSFFFLNAKLSLRDNGLIVFVNFSFSSGCDLHDRRQNY